MPRLRSGSRHVFPRAFHGADIFYQVRDTGVEDYTVFASRPAREELVYELELRRVAGLRLVRGVLELLDSGGAPRLRVAPPFVVDAAGRHAAAMSVEGCAFDTSPVAPWGRPVTPPGAGHCALRVAWRDVAYPATVDPQWSTTGTPSIALSASANHAATVLVGMARAGKVLVTNDLAQADLFDPATRTFSPTGAMLKARPVQTATLLTVGPDAGKVLLTGGYLAAGSELYDPTTGTFGPGAYPGIDRYEVRAVPLLAGPMKGRILFCSAFERALYDPVARTTKATPGFNLKNEFVATSLITGPNAGKVLVAFGFQSGMVGNLEALLYDPVTDTLAPTASAVSVRASPGLVLVTDGPEKGKVFIFGDRYGTQSAEVYDPVAGAFRQVGTPVPVVRGPVATFFTSGTGVGGVFISGDEPEVVAYDVDSAAFRTVAPRPQARYGTRTQTLLTAGSDKVEILILTGGAPSVGEVYSASTNGAPCTGDAACASGRCVDGVCCGSACTEQCMACDLPGAEGTCNATRGAPRGNRPACPRTSDAVCGASACDGVATSVCTFPVAKTSCGATCSSAVSTRRMCDGKGGCIAEAPGQCPDGFACETLGGGCKTTCSVAADCAPDFACHAGRCISGAVCVDDHTSRTPKATRDCTPYRCGMGGVCAVRCESVEDCTAPNACDTSGACVAPVSLDSTGGCTLSLVRTRPSRPVVWLLLAFAALATGSRRLGRRLGRSS